ncbi:MAG: alpha-2-macroglobulin family protein [bacterium]
MAKQLQLTKSLKQAFHKKGLKMSGRERAKLDAKIQAAIAESIAANIVVSQEKPERISLFSKLVHQVTEHWFRSSVLLAGGSFSFLFFGLLILISIFNVPLVIPIFHPKDQKSLNINISSMANTQYGVNQNTEFLISADSSISTSEIKDNLTVEPQFVYKVTNSDQGIKVIPEETLQKDTIYTLTLAQGTKVNGVVLQSNLTWTFKTGPYFVVTGSTPRDQANNVPATTALEIEFSYNDIDLDSFKSNFYIDPAINIKEFTQIDKKIVMIPENQITPGSYTMAVDTGVKRANGEFLNIVYKSTFNVSTDNSAVNKPTIYFENNGMNSINPVNSDNTIAIMVNDQASKWQKGNLKIYEVNQSALDQPLLNLLKRYQFTNYLSEFSESDLKLVQEVTFNPAQNREYNSSTTIINVKEFALGKLYLAKVSYQDTTNFSYFNKTNLATQVNVLQNETTFLAFDQDQKAINEGTVKIFYKDFQDNYQIKEIALKELTTISNNEIKVLLASVFSNGSDRNFNLNNFFPIGQSFIYNQESAYVSQISQDKDFIAYSKFDKPVYRLGDQVNFKTILKQSDDFVKFSKPDLQGIQYDVFLDNILISSKQILKTNSDWDYVQGNFSLPKFLDTSYLYYGKIILKQNGQEIAEALFKIDNYASPEEDVKLILDNSQVYSGNSELTIGIKGKNLAGDPLANQNVQLVISNEDMTRPLWWDQTVILESVVNSETQHVLDQQITLDATGKAELKLKIPVIKSLNEFSELNLELFFNNRLQDASQIKVTKVGQIALLKPENTSNPVINQDLKFQLETINPLNFEKQANQKVKVEFIRKWQEKIDNGSYYNETTKQVQTSYRYEERSESITTLDLVTNNQGNQVITKKFEKAGTYYAKLTGVNNYQVVNYLMYVSDQNYQAVSEAYTEMTFSAEKYQVGNKLGLQIKLNPDTAVNQDAFLILFKDRIIASQKIKLDKTNLTAEFDLPVETSPKVSVMLVYALGNSSYSPSTQEHINNIEYQTVTTAVERADKKFDITVDTDQTKYQPGDEVILKLKATTNGEAVYKANLNIRVFDKALLKVLGVEAYQNDIYQQTYGAYFPSIGTSAFPYFFNAGGRGDQTPEYSAIRDNFQEVALFSTNVITNRSGEAEVKFKLPDNITTWEIDAEAITSDFAVGSNVKEISSSKALFLTMNLPANLHQGDTLEIPVYLYNFSENDLQGKLQIQGSSNLKFVTPPSDISLGKNQGTNQVLEVQVSSDQASKAFLEASFVANNGQVLDGVKKYFPIYTNLVDLSHQQQGILKGKSDNVFEINLPADATRINAQIIINSDPTKIFQEKGSFQTITLKEIEAGLIQNLALLNNYAKLENPPYSETELRAEITNSLNSLKHLQDPQSGGFSWLGYDAIDLEASVMVAKIINLANQSGLKTDVQLQSALGKYLYQQVYKTQSQANDNTSLLDKAYAIWGLSALQHPESARLLAELQLQLDQIPAPLGQILVADSYLSLGSSGAAYSVAYSILNQAKFENNTAYFVAPENAYTNTKSDEFITAFAYRLLKALNLDQTLADKLELYLLGHYGNNDNLTNSLIAAAFLNYFQINNQNPVKVQMNVNGKSSEFNSNSENILIDNLQSGTNQFKIQISEQAFYSLSYSYQAASEQNFQDSFTVKTEYLPLDTNISTMTLPAGKYIRVRVEVKPKSDVKQFFVKTYLPSGLRPTTAFYGESYMFQSNLFDWWQRTSQDANLTLGGSYINDYLIFSHDLAKKDQVYVFETILLAENTGKFSTAGTYVYAPESNQINSFEAGKMYRVE